MSNCRIERDSDGNVTKVFRPDGLESKLYTKLAAHPLIKGTEVAAGIFKNTFSSKFKEAGVTVKKGNRLFNEPLAEAASIADKYMESLGKVRPKPVKVRSVDVDRANVISYEFEKMEESIDSMETKAAYTQMVKETIAQYEAIISQGYQVEINNEEPYASSADMIDDLRQNKNMKIFSTESGFGDTAITEEQRERNPLLQRTSYVDKNGQPLLANDLFRFVHDFFGHAELGNGFGAIGEENAWRVHVTMYSPMAARAMTTETRGQNSWVNFSGVNDEAFKLRNKARKLRKEGKIEEADELTGQVYDMMKFADQKVGLLPDWVSRLDGNPEFGGSEFRNLDERAQALLLGVKEDKSGSKLVQGGQMVFGKGDRVPVEDVVDTSIMTEEELALLNSWDGKIYMHGNRGGSSAGVAMYVYGKKEIMINLNNPLGTIILSNQKEVNKAILHEIIHAKIDEQVENKEEFNAELTKIIEILSKNKEEANPYVQRIITNFIEKGAPEEVLTYMLTDRSVAEFMASIKSENAEGAKTKISLWNRLLKTIKQVLNNFSLLDETVDILNKYTKNIKNTEAALSKDILRIKKLGREATDGNTYEVTKDVYKKGGLILPVLSLNTTQSELSEELMDNFLREHKTLILTNDLKVGIYKFENSDAVSIDLNLVTPTSNKDMALKIAKALGQESIYNLDTNELEVTGETGENTKSLDPTTVGSIREALVNNDINLVADLIGIEAELVHRINGKLYTSFKEVLKDTKEGDVIELGFVMGGNFTPIVITRRNTNKNTEQGYVNNLIHTGLLSEKKTKVGVEYRYEAAGETTLSKVLNAALVRDDAGAYLGNSGVKQDGYTFILEKTRGKIPVMGRDGEVHIVDNAELDAKTYEELKAEYENHVELITQREWEASKVAYRDSAPVISESNPVKSEEELQVRLLSFLSKLGVRTMAITEYVKKYRAKHGVNPSAKGLADIANQIVAYTKGDVETLSEEAAHFINEALPQDKVANVLRNIHKTAEWAEFNQEYREIYSKEYQGEELENVVRREVLGKIVAKVIMKQLQGGVQTETQQNIFAKVYEVIVEFFENLRNRYSEDYNTELNQYLNEVEELLSTEEISDLVNLENFKHNKLVLYNTGTSNTAADKLRKIATGLAQQLQSTEKTLLGAGLGSKSSIRELDRVQGDLEHNLQVESILSLVSMVNTNVRALGAAIKDSKVKNKPYFLSNEENIAYQNIKHVSSKALGEIKVLLEDIKAKTKTYKWDNILLELNKTSSSIRDLNAEAGLIDSQNVERLVEETMQKHSIPEYERDTVKKWIDKAEADTNLFHSTFGQLVHAKDGMLNLAGRVLKNMKNEEYENFYNATKDFQNKLKDLGVTEKDLGSKFVDGQFIISEYDFNKFEQDINEAYAETYNKVIEEVLADPNTTAERKAELVPVTGKTNAEILEMKLKGELEVLTLSEETLRKNKERSLVVPLIERTMVDSYYTEYEAKMQKAGISEVTKQELSNYLSDVSALKKKAYREEGGVLVLDYNSLSEYDKIKLADLHKRRKLMKSYTDESGEIKPGLKYSRVNGELEIDPKTRQPVVLVMDSSKLTDASQIALDLNKLDSEFENKAEKDNAKLFYDTLDKIDKEEGREAAIKFLENNAYTSLSQEFWEKLNIEGDIESRIKEMIAEKPELAREATNILFNIKLFTFKIKNVIKLHNRKNNPSEVEVEMMSPTSIDAVKTLQKVLRTEIDRANKLLGENTTEEQAEETGDDGGFLSGVSDVNESYRKELRALDIYESENDTAEEAIDKVNKEIAFAKEHMSDSNASQMEAHKRTIEQFISGNRADVTKSISYVLKEMQLEESDLENELIRAEVMRRMIRGRLLPYYKRYTSEAYTEYTEGLQTTPSLSEYLQNGKERKTAYVEISPNPTFFDVQENAQLNKNYKKDFKGGYLQPKMSKYKNKKFEELFGTIQNGKSSKNPTLYQAYLSTLEYNEKALDAMNVGETHNKYKLPQVRKRDIQRFSTIFKGNVMQNTRNFVKDALSYTEEDMIQGDNTFGSDIKVIPKMYINSLENPEDISTDLFYTLTLRAKEAYGRQAKVKHYGDLMSIYDKVSARDMNGKDPKSSNTYRMMKSAIDYNLFGVKETVTYPVKTPFGAIDLTKVARMLLSFVKFRNLGVNVVIPITSMLTGEITRKMETMVGEHIDARSQKLGTKEYRKLAVDGMKEIGVVNTESKLNVLGQYFKSYDMTESFDNSNYGRWLKFLPRTAMALHTAANYALYGKNTIGVLHDYRVVEGKMMNRNEFLQKKNTEGVSTKEAKEEWLKSEDKVMYSYLIHEKNKMSWDRAALQRDLSVGGRPLTEEELDKAIEDMYTDTQRYISLVNSLIDGQIPEEDKVLAQRHFLLSYFMTHRGWLSIAVARRFKNRHLNMDTNILEEGSYRSMYGYLGTFFKEWRSGNMVNFMRAFKETWNGSYTHKGGEFVKGQSYTITDLGNTDFTAIGAKENKVGVVFTATGVGKGTGTAVAPKTDELARKNMRRVAIDSGVLASLMVLSVALRMAADDDENEDVFSLQLANYLTYRTLNEMSSTQFNIGGNLMEAIEAPFVGMNTVKNLFDVGEVFSGEEVKHGTYRGMSERSRYMTKMVPGMKQYFDLQNMHQTYDTYKFYNRKNFSLTPANLLWMNTVDSKD